MIPQIQPYQRRMLEFVTNIPDGYAAEFTHTRTRRVAIARPKDGKGPVLIFDDGKWRPLKG
jgi:hypothetical protein